VILEWESGGVSGMEIVKEILSVNPRQRIVLVLTSEVYHRSITKKLAEEPNTPLAIIQRPAAIQSVIDLIELKEVYSELRKKHVDTDAIRRANFRHEQILNILNLVSNQRNRI
jgi:hypothetical protein